MGPDIDLIRKSAFGQNLKMVVWLVAHMMNKYKNIKVVGLVWEWFGGVGEAIGNNKRTFFREINYYKITKIICYDLLYFTVCLIYLTPDIPPWRLDINVGCWQTLHPRICISAQGDW